MSTFLMIHGAWHGGWCFEPLRKRLEQGGHRLIAPTLPGMDGGDVSLAEVTLDGWADFVAGLVAAQDQPVILCGHSRGGIVISSVAERVPQSISALVYITAFMLPDGQSLRDFQMAAPNAVFGAALRPCEDGISVRFDGTAAPNVLYHRADAKTRLDASSRLVAEPLKPLVTPLSLSDAGFGSVPRHYIECSDDRAILLKRQRDMQAALPCLTVTTLDSDHSPFLCCPQALVEALIEVAR